MKRHKILLIEDSKQFRLLVEASLGEQFSVVCASTRSQAMLLLDGHYDLILLDVGLPDGDGYDICDTIRRSPKCKDVPVIFLTSRESRDDLLTAYSLGADDFLTKPFDPHVLKACVTSKIKRFRVKSEEIVTYEDVEINLRSMRVALADGSSVKLTKTEFALAVYFISNIETVLSRQQILDHVWGGAKHVIDRTIDVHINNLRKKIPAFGRRLQAVHGSGYRLEKAASGGPAKDVA